MDLYKEYMKNNLDLSALGLMKRDGDGYFCTPKNAQIIGWTGVEWQMIFRERSREDTEIVLFLK